MVAKKLPCRSAGIRLSVAVANIFFLDQHFPKAEVVSAFGAFLFFRIVLFLHHPFPAGFAQGLVAEVVIEEKGVLLPGAVGAEHRGEGVIFLFRKVGGKLFDHFAVFYKIIVAHFPVGNADFDVAVKAFKKLFFDVCRQAVDLSRCPGVVRQQQAKLPAGEHQNIFPAQFKIVDEKLGNGADHGVYIKGACPQPLGNTGSIGCGSGKNIFLNAGEGSFQ